MINLLIHRKEFGVETIFTLLNIVLNMELWGIFLKQTPKIFFLLLFTTSKKKLYSVVYNKIK